MIDARSLRRWSDLDDRRRAQYRAGLALVPGWLWAVMVGVAGGAYVARAVGAVSSSVDTSSVVSASRLWLAALVASHCVVIFGAPFRMYWRRDSGMLARLPIPGAVLFRVALWRGARATGSVSLACAIAALAFGPWLSWQLALRHLALVGVAASGAALLAPSAALAAGAMVASDKLEAALAQMGGEFQPPKTGWLGMLPGLVATAIVLAIIGAADWALGAPDTAFGSPVWLLLPPVVVSVAAVAWALRRADRVMLAAVREVSALDSERLAHIERTGPTLFERSIAKLIGPRARIVLYKDVRLARRRFPMPYFLSSVGLLTLWIVAAVVPDAYLSWTVVVVACMGAYGVVMAWRRLVPPVEYRRYLQTLAVSARDVGVAKQAQTALWFGWFLGAGIVPAVVRAPDPSTSAIALLPLAVGCWLVAARARSVTS